MTAMRATPIPIAALLTLLAASLAPSAAAQGATDANPGFPDWVEAEYELSFPDYSHVGVRVTLSIHEVRARGTHFTADGLRSAFADATTLGGAAEGDAFVASVEADLQKGFVANLQKGFPKALDIDVERVDIVRSSLQGASDANPYYPTVDVVLEAVIAQDRSAFGIGSLSDAAVDAAFDAGARVDKTLTLVADPGYEVRYSVLAPGDLSWASTSHGATSSDGRRLLVDLANTGGRSDLVQTVSVSLRDAKVTPPTAEDVRSSVDIAITSFALQGEKLPLTAEIVVDLHALGVESRFPSALPSSVTLPFVSATGVRNLKAAGAIKAGDLASSEADLLNAVRSALAGSLGEGVEVHGGFDDASLAAGATGPVRFRALATGGYPVPAAEGKSLDSLFRVGGSIVVEFTLSTDEDRLTTFSITVPEGLEFADPSADGAADGNRVEWTVDNRGSKSKRETPVSVRVHDAEAPGFSEEEASLNVVIDLKDVDVSVAKAAGGDFGRLLVDVTVEGNLGVLRVPDEFAASMPDGLDLQYLSSDAIRVLYRDGLITEEQLADLDARLLADMQQKIGEALGSTAPVNGGLDRATLDPSLVSDPLSGDVPIVFRASLSVAKALSGGGEPQATAAVALYTVQQAFDLPRVQGLDTTYKVILPKGLAVVDASATSGDVERGTTDDGREFFTVRPQSDEQPAHATVAMAVTPSFVVAKFWPVLLGAVLLLVLVIGGPIVGFVMVRRRRRRAA